MPRAARAIPLANAVAPSLVFDLRASGITPPPYSDLADEPTPRQPPRSGKVPTNDEDLAFLSVAELGALLRDRRITSTYTREKDGRSVLRFGDCSGC